MAGGPAGPEVGRVTVRVAPDTSRFDRDLKRQLTKKRLDELGDENRVPIKFEVDQQDLRRQINRIRVPKVVIPVDIDRRQVRDAINKSLAAPLRLRAVTIPVRVDAGQARRALREAVERVGSDPESLALNLNGDGLRRQIDTVLDSAREVGVEIPAEIDQRSLERSVERMREDVSESVSDAIEDGSRRANVPEIDIPVRVDESLLQKVTEEARIKAGEVFQREQLVLKLDADDAVLRAKLVQIEARLRALRDNPRIVIEAEERKILGQIETIQRRLDALNNQRSTPQVIVRIQDEEAKLRALRDRLNELNRTVTSKAELDSLQLEQKLRDIELRLSQLADRRTKARVDLEVEQGELQRILAAGPRPRVNVDVDVDRASFSRLDAAVIRGIATATSALGRFLNLLGRVMPSVLGTAFSVAGRAFTGLSQSLGTLSQSMGVATRSGSAMGSAITGGLASAFGVALQLAQALGALGAISLGLSVAGAAISAAWGLVSTAIAAIPAALFLLAAPMASIMLGLDGIKRAAATLTPEFDRMKVAVSATFEQGMRPAFEAIRGMMPDIQDGMVGIADAISVAATKIAQFAAEEQNVGLLRLAFDNVRTAITDLVPGLQDIYIGFLQVASQRGAFDALTTAVNTFGDAFQRSVTRLIGDGTMQRAFQGLEEVLAAVMRAFVGLVENGIRLFASAAPGIKTFLDDLTNFFGRFDWDRLGAAVGNVFRGLGETLRGIPQGTIESLTTSFERLGAIFRDAGFQASLQNIIDKIPAVIDFIGQLADAFVRGASIIAGSVDVVQGTARVFGAAIDWMNGKISFSEMLSKIDTAGKEIDEGWRQIGDGFRRGAETAAGAADAAGSKLYTAISGIGGKYIPPAFGSIVGEVGNHSIRVNEAVGTGLGQVAPTAGAALEQVPPTAEAALAPLGIVGTDAATALHQGLQSQNSLIIAGVDVWALSVQLGLQKMVTAIETGLTGVGTSLTAGLTSANSTIIAAVNTWALSVQLGMQRMATAVTTAMTAVSTAMTTALVGVNSVIIAAVGTWALSVQLGMQRMVTAVTTAMTGVSTAMTAALIGVNSQIIAAVGTWALSVQLGMQRMVTAVTAGFVAVAQAAVSGMTSINSQIIAGASTWAASMQLGMANMANRVTSGFANVRAQAAAGMANTNSAIIAGANTWAASVQAGLANMASRVTAGFATITNAVTSGMTAANSRIIAGFSSMTASAQLGMSQIAARVTAGSDQMVQAIGQAMTRANQQMTAGFTSMRASAQLGMASFVSAVRTGMNNATSEMRNGINQMIAALNGASGRFRSIGASLGDGLAAGLRSRLGTVRAAATELANAAAAATAAAAAVRSPSRVFMDFGEMMGLGLALGLEGMERRVARAAKGLVGGAVAQADAAKDVFTAPHISDWRTTLQGAMDMSSAAPAQPLVGTMVVNTPQGATAKDMMDQALFRLRHVRRGVYSG